MDFNLKQINTCLASKKTILIGENHGVSENPQFVRALLEALGNMARIKFVGFEYPSFVYEDFLKAVSANTYESIENLEVTQMLIKDGRFSRYHFDLLLFLYEKKVPFVFFDSGRGTWDDRDKAMYENITKSTNMEGEGEVVIIVAGNIHTKLKELNLNNENYKPLGTYFRIEDILLIELIYHSGEFFNFSKRVFTPSQMPEEAFEVISDHEIHYHLENVQSTK
jgi:erythromycin esterase-like protein